MQHLLRLTSIMAMIGGVQPLMAQEAASDNDTASASMASGDIIVTAQKRAQRLQDVPISVSAFTPEALESANIQDSRQLTQVTPGLRMTQSTLNTHPFIRGVGSAPSTAGDEASVATYIDGVYIPQNTGAVFDLGYIEGVEVLKGPQGTLFGRNATGGAILITTAAPSYDTVVKGEVTYGNYNMMKGRMYVSGGLSDNVAVSLGGAYTRRDGNYKDNVSGKRLGDFHRYAVSGKILIEPSDRLRLTLTGNHSYSTEKSGLFLAPINGNSVALIDGVPIPTEPYKIDLNAKPFAKIKSSSVAARVEYEGDGFNILSISSYIRHRFDVVIDVDGTQLPVTEIRQSSPDRAWSQELQFSSNGNSNFSWLAGLFYFYRDSRSDPLVTIVGTSPAREVHGVAKNNAFAAFVDGSYRLGDFELTGGLRYSRERKRMSNALNGVPVVVDAEKTFSAFTPRVVLSYKPDRDFLAYASYSRGFKSGIFNTSAAALTSEVPIEPEKVSAYEVGFKASVSPEFSINGAAFLYDQKDLQVNANDRLTGLILLTNAGKTRVKGAEIEAVMRPSPDFTFRIGTSFLDAKYREFTGAQVTIPNPATGGLGNIQVLADVSGSRVIRTPGVTVSTSAEYIHRTDDAGDFAVSTNLYYSSDFYWDTLNRIQTPAHVLLNAQLKWTLPDERFAFAVFGTNLTNSRIYRNVTSSGAGDVVDRIDPRMYGVRASFEF